MPQSLATISILVHPGIQGQEGHGRFFVPTEASAPSPPIHCRLLFFYSPGKKRGKLVLGNFPTPAPFESGFKKSAKRGEFDILAETKMQPKTFIRKIYAPMETQGAHRFFDFWYGPTNRPRKELQNPFPLHRRLWVLEPALYFYGRTCPPRLARRKLASAMS